LLAIVVDEDCNIIKSCSDLELNATHEQRPRKEQHGLNSTFSQTHPYGLWDWGEGLAMQELPSTTACAREYGLYSMHALYHAASSKMV